MKHFFILLTIFTFYVTESYSQDIIQVPSRQSAFEAFSKKNYEQSYTQFKELVSRYPTDPLYKYYCGVCLVRLGRDPVEAVILLEQALQSAATVRSVPSDALFYLGRAQQMSGKFIEAVKSFNLYSEQGGKKEASEQDIHEYIQQCNEKRGQVTEPEIKLAEIVKNDKDEISQIENKPITKQAIQQPVETFAFFEVLEKHLSNPNDKITINPEVPAGLIYCIKIAIFKNPVSLAYFKGITPVYGFKIDGTDLTNYYAGMFRKSSDASKALIKVKSAGFKDAFIVAFLDKKVVSVERSSILEKEWGKKPFISIVNAVSETPIDNIPVQKYIENGESIKIDNIPVPQQKRVALIIGNGNYQSSSPLANPENDARAIKSALQSVGFTVMEYENLNQSQMKKAIDDFGLKLKSNEVGLFYYAGHGIQSKGYNYLIPVDAQLQSEQQVEYDCVQADRVLALMEASGTKVNILILDACRNNPFERSWTRSSTGRGLAFMDAPSGTLIAYSTSPGRTASDGSGNNSPYTSAILESMKIPNITIIQMFQNVRSIVSQKSSKQQIPWESTSLTGDFYFNKQ
jgi:hypothetical protein